MNHVLRALAALPVLALAVTACTTATPTATVDHCTQPLDHRLAPAIEQVESRLASGCEYHFDDYLYQLLVIAEDRPGPDNKRAFSESLVRMSDSGLISRRQAQALYNRYFNVKFTSFSGDFNTCAQACPDRSRIIRDMEAELADKELGLIRISDDRDAYYRADHLFQQTQLVLEATCRACASGG